MSIEQSGNAIQVSFDAAYTDAHGAMFDGGGQAKIAGKNTLEFKWKTVFRIRELPRSSVLPMAPPYR